jgi:hypothetical protein
MDLAGLARVRGGGSPSHTVIVGGRSPDAVTHATKAPGIRCSWRVTYRIRAREKGALAGRVKRLGPLSDFYDAPTASSWLMARTLPSGSLNHAALSLPITAMPFSVLSPGRSLLERDPALAQLGDRGVDVVDEKAPKRVLGAARVLGAVHV